MLDIIFHLDTHLSSLLQIWGPWTLAALFVVVFCETGLVFAPFLPGDSLLFATGAVSALCPGDLPIAQVIPALFVAAVLGDAVNSETGRYAGRSVSSWLARRETGTVHLDSAARFFERHGGRAVVLARFLPLFRTFVPFVAGISGMPRRRFFVFNVVGALAWVGSFTLMGYFMGNLPAVKGRFHLIIVGILLISIAPAAWEAFAAWRRQARERAA